MIKADFYYYRDPYDAKIFTEVDWFTYEDRWHQMYRFKKPLYGEKKIDECRELNKNRYRWFRLSLNISGYRFNLDIRLNKVGILVRGKTSRDWAISNIPDKYKIKTIHRNKNSGTWYALVEENNKRLKLISRDHGNHWAVWEG